MRLFGRGDWQKIYVGPESWCRKGFLVVVGMGKDEYR